MKKYNIGYTSGVYDLFHIGHLNILKSAKEQCEFLIVGVSTDELVLEYKNKKTVIPFEQRIEIIKAIRYVDMVVPQTSMDKMAIWKEHHFNVMFHGDEWKNSELYRMYIEEFEKIGVDIVFLKHTEGISSSKLQQILKGNLYE